MSRFGIFPFVGIGHLNPLTALGRRLQARGHDVTVFQMPIARAAIKASGLKFWPIDAEPGDMPAAIKQPQKASDANRLSAVMRSMSSVEVIKANARRVLRGGPEAVRAAGVDALVVDQHDLAAGSVADLLGLPFVTVSVSPPVYLDDCAPLSYFGWPHSTGRIARFRNRLANAVASRFIAPVLSIVNEKRRMWGLPQIDHLNEVFSKRALITQLPEVLDFPCSHRPTNIFHAGPFHDGKGRLTVDFPWERLDRRPLVYASLGTILTSMPWVFRIIAEACSVLDVQLVISLGGGGLCPEDLAPLPGDPVIVHYAPQVDVLRRTRLVISHAGLNTTLESLAQGAPLIAIPIVNDQPGVAARIRWAGVGTVIPLRRLSVRRLRKSIQNVLEDPAYRLAARRIQIAIQERDGLECAAQLIERVLTTARAPSH